MSKLEWVRDGDRFGLSLDGEIEWFDPNKARISLQLSARALELFFDRMITVDELEAFLHSLPSEEEFPDSASPRLLPADMDQDPLLALLSGLEVVIESFEALMSQGGYDWGDEEDLNN